MRTIFSLSPIYVENKKSGALVRLQHKFQIAIRSANYSVATKKSYWSWIRQYLKFHGMRHPAKLSGSEVPQFLTWLVMKKNLAVNTQQQALSALVFLYRQVLDFEEFTIPEWTGSKRTKRLPVVSHVLRLSEC